MYAVVQIGTQQFKVSEGDVITAIRLAEDKGKSVHLDKVLLYSDGKDIRVGQPALKDVKISATVVEHTLGPKLIAFKKRKRKDSEQKIGHRQRLTQLNITKIEAKSA